MADNQSRIVGLKQIEIKWLSNNSFTLDNSTFGNIVVDAFFFSDNTILGKVEYPFSIVIGKHIDNLGTYLTILDEETGRHPHLVIAAASKTGKDNQFYGTITPFDTNNPNQEQDNALAIVTATNVRKFEGESINDVSQKITMGTNFIQSTPSANNAMYNGFLATPYENIVKYIKETKELLDQNPSNEEFQDLEAISFVEFGDE